MARYRRSRRRYYGRRNKYSIEQRPGFIAGNGWTETGDDYLDRQALIPIVQSTTQEGVRKVTRISLSLASPAIPPNQNGMFYWCIIYLPEGMTANELSSTGDLYQPSQNVLASGIVTSTQGKMRIATPLSKNLNAGDSIYLLLGTNHGFITTNSQGPFYRFNYLLRYAICYN